MSVLVLDSGAVTRLARRDQDTAGIIAAFVRDGIWPPLVPSVVLVECLSGRQRNDVLTNRFLKTCEIFEEVPEQLARRAAVLRALAGRGSAVDALVVAVAEPGGAVLSGDLADLRALAAHADDVVVLRS
ncbi:MAG TPA: PIN domain-containing protein [Acidimicrobiales bacterium]|nr:PIN domain-containing protein [Acidimicrobiales bacterium]